MQPDGTIASLVAITDDTAVAQLADGRIFVLRNCWYCAGTEIDNDEGQFKARFEGLSCRELEETQT